MEKFDAVYILELIGDTENSGGSVIFEIGGASTDLNLIEKLKVEKDEWLDEYFHQKPITCEKCNGSGVIDEDDCDHCDGKGKIYDDIEYVLFNTDLTYRPYWSIRTLALLK